MANILKRPSHAAKLGHNGFDMSKRILFTSSVGQLLPVYYDFLNPGDNISIDSSLFTRTQPMRSSAFTRVTEHIDYFFVPISLINSYWENAFYGISDLSSSKLVDTTDIQNDTLPNFFSLYMTQSEFFTQIKNSISTVAITPSGVEQSYFMTQGADEFGIPYLYNFFRLSSLLGMSETLCQIENDGDLNSFNFPSSVNMNLFYVYQKIYSDYYRLSEWESTSYRQWSQDIWAGSSASFGSTSRLLPVYSSSSSPTSSMLKWSPFKMHYRPWKKDFFTNVQVSPQFSSRSSVSSNGIPFGNNSLFPNVSGGQLGLSMSNVWESTGLGVPGYPVTPSGASQGQPDNQYVFGFSPNLGSLRSAMAWEKLSSITQRAGKHVDDQTLAHFGFKVPQGVSNETYYLGSHSSRLQIGEVVGTATTQDSVLGEIAGRGLGVSQGNKDIKFKAPCHGYVMAIYSAVPEADYQAIGFDKLNALVQPTDFYHPEFDRLGMQPLYSWQAVSGALPSGALPNNTVICGWQYRYSELKSKYDTVHGAFNYTLRDWVAPRKPLSYSYGFSSVASDRPAVFSDWVIQNFYVDPSLLDSVFALNFSPLSYQTGPTNPTRQYPIFNGQDDVYRRSLSFVFERDPLLHSIDFKVYKTSCMSTYGLPNL